MFILILQSILKIIEDSCSPSAVPLSSDSFHGFSDIKFDPSNLLGLSVLSSPAFSLQFCLHNVLGPMSAVLFATKILTTKNIHCAFVTFHPIYHIPLPPEKSAEIIIHLPILFSVIKCCVIPGILNSCILELQNLLAQWY